MKEFFFFGSIREGQKQGRQLVTEKTGIIFVTRRNCKSKKKANVEQNPTII